MYVKSTNRTTISIGGTARRDREGGWYIIISFTETCTSIHLCAFLANYKRPSRMEEMEDRDLMTKTNWTYTRHLLTSTVVVRSKRSLLEQGAKSCTTAQAVS